MSLKDRIPKQWGQYYLKKLIDGDPDPLLVNWNTFEQGFLSNWTDTASVQVACHNPRMRAGKRGKRRGESFLGVQEQYLSSFIAN
jgi:hypothetical protein